MPAGNETTPKTPSIFGDVDGDPTKIYRMDHRNDAAVKPLFALGFGKRPVEELYLYILKDDPYNLTNRANETGLAQTKKSLRQCLDTWMQQEHDPRLGGGGDQIDKYESTTRAWITRDSIILLDE